MEASVRLQNELKNFRKARGFGFYANPNPKNVFEWKCQFYHRGFFFGLKMIFKKSYPITPPEVTFNKDVYHPNIYSDRTVCLDIIGDNWSPSLTIIDILGGLKQLLDFPNPKSPANGPAASLHKKDMKEYETKVLECYKKHHSKYKQVNFK